MRAPHFTTTFISSTNLQTSLLASDIASPGSAGLTVYNSPPGGSPSNTPGFAILLPYHAHLPFVIDTFQVIYDAASLGVTPHGGSWASMPAPAWRSSFLVEMDGALVSSFYLDDVGSAQPPRSLSP